MVDMEEEEEEEEDLVAFFFPLLEPSSPPVVEPTREDAVGSPFPMARSNSNTPLPPISVPLCPLLEAPAWPVGVLGYMVPAGGAGRIPESADEESGPFPPKCGTVWRC